MPSTPDRVTIFVDYQNVYATARTLFHAAAGRPQDGHIWPIALGNLIVARRPRPSVLHEMRIYRGLPDSTRQPTLYAVNDRQTAVWTGDSRVVVFRRPLRYPSDWPQSKPMEKGIDVALAERGRAAALLKHEPAVVSHARPRRLSCGAGHHRLPATETTVGGAS